MSTTISIQLSSDLLFHNAMKILMYFHVVDHHEFDFCVNYGDFDHDDYYDDFDAATLLFYVIDCVRGHEIDENYDFDCDENDHDNDYDDYD